MAEETIRDQLLLNVEGVVEDVQRVEAEGGAVDWLGEALDVQVTVKSSLMVPAPGLMLDRKVSAIVTLGGPFVCVNLESIGDEHVVVVGLWGSARMRERVHAPMLAAAMDEMADLHMGIE